MKRDPPLVGFKVVTQHVGTLLSDDTDVNIGPGAEVVEDTGGDGGCNECNCFRALKES